MSTPTPTVPVFGWSILTDKSAALGTIAGDDMTDIRAKVTRQEKKFLWMIYVRSGEPIIGDEAAMSEATKAFNELARIDECQARYRASRGGGA